MTKYSLAELAFPQLSSPSPVWVAHDFSPHLSSPAELSLSYTGSGAVRSGLWPTIRAPTAHCPRGCDNPALPRTSLFHAESSLRIGADGATCAPVPGSSCLWHLSTSDFVSQSLAAPLRALVSSFQPRNPWPANPHTPTWVLWLNYELNYVLSGSAVHCPFPKVKPKHFPFLLAQLRFVWRFPAHRAAHPGSPLLRTNRSQLLRAWHRNFVPWYILYQSVKSQNSLQIQGVVPPTTKKLQQNF